MTLEEYAAQQAQNTQQPQEPQQAEGNPLDVFAAQRDAERLSLLLAETREIIDENSTPAAMLTRIAAALFGEKSAEAEAVAAAIEKDKAPGGHELALAEIRQRRSMIKQQIKQLDELQRDLAGQLEQLNTAEREQTNQQAAAATLDRALADTMTFCKQLRPQENMLHDARELYNKHRGSPAAMGLLYGSLAELTRNEYTAGHYDLIQQQDFFELKAAILSAANG